MESLKLPKNLSIALDELYKIFSKYPLRKKIVACRCPVCLSAEVEKELLSYDLREIPSRIMSAYNHDAGIIATQEKDQIDFKHFLPRLIELTVNFDWPSHSVEPSLARLAEADYKKWITIETAIIEKVIELWWKFIITTDQEYLCKFGFADIGSCLCLIAKSSFDIHKTLSSWEKEESINAILCLADFIYENSQYIHIDSKLKNAFWNSEKDNMQLVVQWIKQPLLKKKLEEAFFKYQNEPYSDKISLAYQAL